MTQKFAPLIILLALVIVAGCSTPQVTTKKPPAPVQIEQSQPAEVALPFRVKLVAEADDTNAFELLSQNHQVETQDFGEAGVFVKGIDGLVADTEHYWAFYLNGEYATAGVSQTALQKGDTIEFVYESIDQSGN